LRNLKSPRLKGIYGGMLCIVDELKAAIVGTGVNWANQVKTRHTLQSISTERNKVTLKFANGAKAPNFDHVILALPYWPLKELSIRNDQLFATKTVEDLSSVFGFPMTKCFVGVKRAWWRDKYSDEEMTNKAALQFPTREVHYMTTKQCKEKAGKNGKLPKEEIREGAILAYADRPASAFWANYVTKQGPQVTPECWSARHGDPNTKNIRLVKKIVKLLQETAPEVKFSEDEYYFLWHSRLEQGAIQRRQSLLAATEEVLGGSCEARRIQPKQYVRRELSRLWRGLLGLQWFHRGSFAFCRLRSPSH
jgi:Flavin containing amine oxidoreductase